MRCFVRVLQKLDLTHDIFGLSGMQVLEPLPAEFDAWRPDDRQAPLSLVERGSCLKHSRLTAFERVCYGLQVFSNSLQLQRI